MPSLAVRAKNFFPSVIIRSPLHAMMSAKYTTLTFTGRKSGRMYRTPIAYVREGNRVLMSTAAPWHRNLTGGAPVTLRLRGHLLQGIATTVHERSVNEAIVRTLVEAIPSYAGPAGLAVMDGRVPDTEIVRSVAAGRVAIVVELDSAR